MVDYHLEYLSNDGERENCFLVQKKKVYLTLLKKPMTMLELDELTGIRRANICRHIKSLLDENKIAVLEQRKCSISGHNKVNVYTTNKDLFPLSNQLEMF
jgi:predicted transcriptional regulator